MSLVFSDYKDGLYRFCFNQRNSAQEFLELNDLDFDIVKLNNLFYLIAVPMEVVQALGGLDTDLSTIDYECEE